MPPKQAPGRMVRKSAYPKAYPPKESKKGPQATRIELPVLESLFWTYDNPKMVYLRVHEMKEGSWVNKYNGGEFPQFLGKGLVEILGTLDGMKWVRKQWTRALTNITPPQHTSELYKVCQLTSEVVLKVFQSAQLPNPMDKVAMDTKLPAIIGGVIYLIGSRRNPAFMKLGHFQPGGDRGRWTLLDRFFMNRSEPPTLPTGWEGDFEEADLFLIHLVLGGLVDECTIHETLRGAAEAASHPIYTNPHKLEWHTSMLKDKAIECMNDLMDLKSSAPAETDAESPEQPDSKKAPREG